MTALPQPPAHLLTVAEYAQLGETTTGYTELQEGNMIMSPSYWIVDLDEPATLLDCHLAGPLGYADGGSITGIFTTTALCPILLELDRAAALRNPRVP